MDFWPKALNFDILHQYDRKTGPLGWRARSGSCSTS
jgi:hypothetical protein